MVHDVMIKIKATITKRSNTTKNVHNIFTKYIETVQCMSVSSLELDWEDLKKEKTRIYNFTNLFCNFILFFSSQ